MDVMSRDISLRLIDTNPRQPRRQFSQEAIEELAQSMTANGLVVPILVHPVGERFVLVHGERRVRAARLLDWETIPADIRKDLTPEEGAWLALVENIQRSDLTPIEEAAAYQEFLSDGITQTELGKRIGKSQSHIATKLRLLNLLEEVQAGLIAGKVTEGHAKQLLRIVANAEKQVELFRRATEEQWSVSRTRLEVDDVLRDGSQVKDLNSAADIIWWFFEQNNRIPGHDPYPEERLPDHFSPPIGIKRLPVSEIVDDPKTESRESRAPSYAEWLAEIYGTLPPIAVYLVGDKYVLVDGRSRLRAAQLLGLQEVECRIYEFRDNLELWTYGIAANSAGGLRLTKEDLERVARKLAQVGCPHYRGHSIGG